MQEKVNHIVLTYILASLAKKKYPLVATIECMGRELDKLVVYALKCGVTKFMEGEEVSV